MRPEIDHIIAQLRIRTGSYGVERKNLINNLFKSIIDLSFPNIVKWLFLECDKGPGDGGIFELLDAEEYRKNKRMSKYKKDEMQFDVIPEVPEYKEQEVPLMTNLNITLDISLEQNDQLIAEKVNVVQIK